MQIHAQIKDGKLIPQVPIGLPDSDDVIVTISEPAGIQSAPAIRDDPRDPCPEGGLALLEWFGRHRVALDPDLLQDIAESAEYLDQEPADEP
jgi:hypothetical protein